MLKTQQEIRTHYELLINELKDKISTVKVKIDRFSFIRIALLIAEIFAIVGFVKAETYLFILIFALALLAPIAMFVWVVKKQTALSKTESYFRNLLWVYQNEVNLIDGKENGYDQGSAYESETHPYSSDLDIFGKSSLFALINRCSTKIGLVNLSQHLANAASVPEILNRQAAVKEVMEEIELTFSFRANLRGHDVGKIEQIKNKLKNQLAAQLKFTQKRILSVYIKVLPFIVLSLFIAALVFGGKLWGILILIALLNAGLTFFYSKEINTVYYAFSGGSAVLNDYAVAIKWTEEKVWKSPYIQDLFASKEKVSEQLSNLAKIIQAFDARLNILLSTILNFFLLWDLRCSIRLDKWHQSASLNVENGLDRIGYFEELIAIATLAYNHPQWSFPQLHDEFFLKAEELGHPLINPEKRINNDFSLTEQPTVDIITGSNMAGKSTFLRTLGINMVLAYAGAPVCAKLLQLSIFNILTYMRIKDSLNENTSTFKAELNRLKMILSQVEADRHALVLIDEMLRGTNSRDKYLGSKVFIEKLIQLKTPTLFATHDLQLSELEADHKEGLRNYHFDIQINAGEMQFDYLLKAGPCSTFNAAILLKEIGLALD